MNGSAPHLDRAPQRINGVFLPTGLSQVGHWLERRIVVLTFVLCSTVCSQNVDPFARDDPAAAQGPKRLAPTAALLARLKEPSLKDTTSTGTTEIRFIWVPTFNRPFSIRATHGEAGASLHIVRMKGEGGYDWGEIETSRTVELSKEQWTSLEALVAVDGAREPSQKTAQELRENFVAALSGLDGSTWYLEVRDRSGYTVEGVPNPVLNDLDEKEKKSLKQMLGLDLDPFLAVCRKLFEYSGLDEKPEY